MAAALVAALIVGAVACDGGGTESKEPPWRYGLYDGDLAEALMDRFRECGFLTEGPRSPERWRTSRATRQCAFQCFLGLDCASLASAVRAYQCSPNSPPPLDSAAQACVDSCRPTFRCGSGKEINADLVCDGQTDCFDLGDFEDEKRCEASCYVSGRTPDFDCNGTADCASGADELGCAYFVCDGARNVGPREVCDDRADCDDGTDEMGCGTFSICGP